MQGEAISATQSAIQALISAIRQDDVLVDNVFLSLMTYDSKSEELLSQVSVGDWLNDLNFEAKPASPSFLGRALGDLMERLPQQNESALRPLVFVFSDGRMTDVGAFRINADELRSRHLVTIVTCLVGSTPSSVHFSQLTPHVLSAATVDSSTFLRLLRSAFAGNSLDGLTSVPLPVPPAEVRLPI